MSRKLLPAVTFAAGLLVGASTLALGETRTAVEEAPDSLVTGIGGVFFKARDPESLREWYGRHLDLEAGPGGVHFLWREHGEPGRVVRTVWSVFPDDTDYFGSSGQRLMVNYRVRDLDALLSRLATEGIHPVKGTEAYPYGRFAWIEDGEGNRVELWEPPASPDRQERR